MIRGMDLPTRLFIFVCHFCVSVCLSVLQQILQVLTPENTCPFQSQLGTLSSLEEHGPCVMFQIIRGCLPPCPSYLSNAVGRCGFVEDTEVMRPKEGFAGDLSLDKAALCASPLETLAGRAPQPYRTEGTAMPREG